HCIGVSHGFPAADELCAVGLVTHTAYALGACRDDVRPPVDFLVRRTGATRRNDRRMLADPFRLDKEIAERGMLSVRVEGLQHDLGVARELELARHGGPVRDRHAPDFSGVVGRYHDLHPRVDVAIPAMERDAITGKRDMIRVSIDGHRLVGGAPYTSTRHVLDVYPLAVVVTRRVAAPACNHDIAVTTVTAAGVRDERSVWNVAEQCDTWLGRVRRVRFPYGWLGDFHRRRRHRLVLVAGTLHYQASWNAFLKHQVVGADQ